MAIVSKKTLLFAVCGGLAFVTLRGGVTKLSYRRGYVPNPSSIAAGRGRLRFDGLCQGASRTGNQLSLRFYPEGDVVVMSTASGAIEQIAAAISRSQPALGRGVYHLHDDDVIFTTSTLSGLIDYQGMILLRFGGSSALCVEVGMVWDEHFSSSAGLPHRTSAPS